VEHYLLKKETSRHKKLAKMKTKDAKKDKNKRKYDTLKDHSKTAKTKFAKRIGTYRPGMNMDDPIGELLKAAAEGGDKEEEQQATKKHVAKRTKPTTKTFQD
jgi:hypothetical protein